MFKKLKAWYNKVMRKFSPFTEAVLTEATRYVELAMRDILIAAVQAAIANHGNTREAWKAAYGAAVKQLGIEADEGKKLMVTLSLRVLEGEMKGILPNTNPDLVVPKKGGI